MAKIVRVAMIVLALAIFGWTGVVSAHECVCNGLMSGEIKPACAIQKQPMFSHLEDEGNLAIFKARYPHPHTFALTIKELIERKEKRKLACLDIEEENKATMAFAIYWLPQYR